jgi:hypothetical protein
MEVVICFKGKPILGSLGSNPIARRFAQFCDFIDSDQIEGSQDELYSNNPDAIFAMLYDEYCFRIPYFQKGKYIGKFNKILDVLKKLIINNSGKIKHDLWQLRNIAQIIAACIHHSVQHSVRKEGTIILQLLIECFGSEIPADLICLLVHAVHLSPFSLNYPLPEPFPPQKDYMQIEPSNIIFPAPPRSEETKKEESCELLRIIFSFLENATVERFEIWLEVLKMTYFALLFPMPCQDMRCVPFGVYGFAVCPPELLNVVIQSLVQWERSTSFPLILPALLANLPIFMEISRQAFLLDPQYCETIEKSVSLFKTWFVEADVLTGKDEQDCWQEYMKNMSLFFSQGAKKGQITEDVRAKVHDIAHKCFRVYLFFAVEFASAMDESTWVFLQNTVMYIAVELSQRATAEPLYDNLFKVLFFIWVKSPHTTREMWKDFNYKIGWLINKKSATEMWSYTVLHLTYIMRGIYYPSPKEKDPTFVVDPYYATIPWTKKSIVTTWEAVFCI